MILNWTQQSTCYRITCLLRYKNICEILQADLKCQYMMCIVMCNRFSKWWVCYPCKLADWFTPVLTHWRRCEKHIKCDEESCFLNFVRRNWRPVESHSATIPLTYTYNPRLSDPYVKHTKSTRRHNWYHRFTVGMNRAPSIHWQRYLLTTAFFIHVNYYLYKVFFLNCINKIRWIIVFKTNNI